MTFVQRSIAGAESIGEQLSRAREALGFSVQKVAEHTKINSRFIQSLEQGLYKELPGPVYVRKYIFELCRMYGLSFKQLEEQLKLEQALSQPKEIKLSPKSSSKPLWIPSLFRWGVVGVVVAVIGAYFTWEVVRLLTPPQVEVSEPSQDIVLDQPTITVKGKTQPGAQVTINGEAADVDAAGAFQEVVALRPGLNRLEIAAQTRFSSQSVVVRQIVVEKPK